MADLKTKPTEVKIEDFLNVVEPEGKREDAFSLVRLMEKITGEKGKMWGPSIVGFGSYHYKYESGHEGDMCLAGFSPRKAATVVYLIGMNEHSELLEKLGKYKASKGCVYIKKLSDVDVNVLEKLIKICTDDLKKKYSA